MNAREGFRRIEAFYWRRWWVIAFAVPWMFLFRYFSQPLPVDVDPPLWMLARPVVLTIGALAVLMTATWIVAGFLTPSDEARTKTDR